MIQKTIISLRKQKLGMLLLLCFLFIAFGVCLLLFPSIYSAVPFANQTIASITGLITIVFFGICAIIYFKKLLLKVPALIIDEYGVTDNSSGVSGGFISWADVTGIRRINIAGQDLVMIDVRNPEYYTERQKNYLKRKTMELNWRGWGSPLSIPANGLETSFEDLFSALHKAFLEKNL